PATATMSPTEHCDECGFRYDVAAARAAGSAIRSEVDAMAAALLSTSDPGRRRRPEAWSPLEYSCHLRDVLFVQRERVLAMRRTERPSVPPMGRDERVEHDGYADQNPVDV